MRRIATVSFAALCQSRKKSGLRVEEDESGNVDRPRRVAIHLGVSAYPSLFAARMSRRVLLRTPARR